MMKKLKVTASEAMDIIEIPAEEQPKYLRLLSLATVNKEYFKESL